MSWRTPGRPPRSGKRDPVLWSGGVSKRTPGRPPRSLEPAVHGHGLDPRRPRRRGRERRLLEHDLLHPLLERHGERVAPGRRRLHMEARQQQRRGGVGGVPMVLKPAVRTEHGATPRPPRRCLPCLAEN